MKKAKTTRFTLPALGVLSATLALMLVAGSVPASASNYFNGFETDTAGWDVIGGQYNATRVASGANGITSATGSFHAEAGQFNLDNDGGSAFSRWGGYSSSFPAGGYITSVDIYLDVNGGYANDTRFDFISAINQPNGMHRRDFDFNAGFYNDTDLTGTGNRFVISASNNAGRSGAFPKNPGRDPFAITSSGWYTFRHDFTADNSGVLIVVLSILDSNGDPVHTWTLSDLSDVVGTTVGGNRYGWFASNEFPFLAFDNTFRTDANLRAQKIEVRDELVTLRNSITDGGDRSKLLDAITHLNNSINPNNWLDDTHPQPNANGEKVFTEEKLPVTKLRELRNSNHSSIPAAQLQDYIDRLLAVDRALTVIAIDEAIAANGNAGKIAAAISELNKGDEEAANDHPDKAIERYKNAWKNAIAA